MQVPPQKKSRIFVQHLTMEDNTQHTGVAYFRGRPAANDTPAVRQLGARSSQPKKAEPEILIG